MELLNILQNLFNMKIKFLFIAIIFVMSATRLYCQTVAAKKLRVDTIRMLSLTPIQIKNSIKIDSLIYDGSGSSGTTGQALLRTATSTGWGTIVSMTDSSKWELVGNDIYNKNSGNVGIGVPMPSYKLDVNNVGGSDFAVNITGESGLRINTQSGGAIFATTSAALGVGQSLIEASCDSCYAISMTSNTTKGAAGYFTNTKSNGTALKVDIGNSGFGFTSNNYPTEKVDIKGNLKLQNTIKTYSDSIFIDKTTFDTTNALLYGRFDQDRLVINGHLNIRNTTATNASLWLNNVKWLWEPTTGSIVLGNRGSYATMSGTYNIAIGSLTGDVITTGQKNIAIGLNALGNTTSSSSNIAIGEQAGWQFSTTTGGNISIGASSSQAMNSSQNTVVGGYAGKQSSTTTTSWRNTIIGYESAQYVNDSCNVMIGYQAGKKYTGRRSVFLGAQAGANLTTQNNVLFIHNNAADSLNALIYGRFDNKVLRINGTEYIKNGLNIGMNDVYTVNIKDTKGGLFAVNVDSSNYGIIIKAEYGALECHSNQDNTPTAVFEKSDSLIVVSIGSNSSTNCDSSGIGLNINVDNGEAIIAEKGRIVNKFSSVLSLLATDQINVEYKNIKVVGNSGGVILTSTPTIRTRNIEEGTEITIFGTDNTNFVTLRDDDVSAGTKLQLEADANCELYEYDNISFIFFNGFWCETSRKNL